MRDAPHEDIPISDRTLDGLRTTAAMVVAIPELAASHAAVDGLVSAVTAIGTADPEHRLGITDADPSRSS